MSRRGGAVTGLLGLGGAVLVGVGLTAWYLQPAAPSDAVTQQGATAGAGGSVGAVAEPVRARWEAGAPRRVLVPSLDIDAPVYPIKTRGDTLIPPSDPTQLGWWADGAKPGADTGSALVTGHTVNAGGGALDDLEEVQRGDRVVVRTDKGRVVYEVQRVRIFSKGAVSNHAERLFSQEAPGRLVLITCEDWDGEQYLSNVVVTATPR